MMDELEFLKKDWKKQGADFPKLTYDEIYKLIHKKSSSIVKWIFIICIAEFLFWGLITLCIPDSTFVIYEKFNLKTFLFVTQALHYVVVFVFIYLFYKNYKTISVIDNTGLLMKNILKTRKTVNYYVYYNLILYVLLSIVLNGVMFSHPNILIENLMPANSGLDTDKFLTVMIVVQIILLLVMCGIIWAYYRIIYGILLKKLNRNYKELESLEV
jgi:Sec-independent protein secretion pathway component TatC